MKKLICALLFLSLAAAEAYAQIDEKPLPVAIERAFPNTRIRRPIVVTHAGDGTDRLFVASQQGVIQVFANKQDVKEDDVKVFLDIEAKVTYKDNENEEGLLGLAFHPKYKENGEFYVHYTAKNAPHTAVISRFHVSKDDPNKADPKEEELFRVPNPYWNHKGGGLVFGPDGYLYISLGDGGSANDPHKNGQNLETLLGKILRIDIDGRDEGKQYAIPKDNPFVGKGKARPEIYAYGLRNVWGLTFDRQTGTLWAADVGQDIWEEIDLIVKGGNYGWSVREGMHPFPANRGSGPREDLIEPIFEYHHNVGKSITGGYVYRGQRVKELIGTYLYADYVTGKIWALSYDEKAKKVTANQLIPSDSLPIIAFGEDQSGDVYCTVAGGQIYRFASKK